MSRASSQIGHNSGMTKEKRDAVIQAEALEQVEIETIRFQLTKRQEDSMGRVEAVGVTRKAFREEYAELKRLRNEKEDHKLARETAREAFAKMDQGELFAKLDEAKEKALADKAKADESRKKKTDKANKKGVVHAEADAKDKAAKNGENLDAKDAAEREKKQDQGQPVLHH